MRNYLVTDDNGMPVAAVDLDRLGPGGNGDTLELLPQHHLEVRIVLDRYPRLVAETGVEEVLGPREAVLGEPQRPPDRVRFPADLDEVTGLEPAGVAAHGVIVGRGEGIAWLVGP